MVKQQTTADGAGETASRRPAAKYRPLKVPQAITVGALAELMDVSTIEIIKQLMRGGIMANVTQGIDFDTAAALAPIFGFRAIPLEQSTAEAVDTSSDEEDPSLLQPRPPVVAILGHVDHGKTTILDAIRATQVAEREVGGITQHIGAYQATHNDRKITFLDTPGHEAFTAMRARGAQATDIAVLVVAADDGIMPQTVEAIAHIKAARVPIVVAINKMDLPDADPDKAKRQLSEQDLLIEEWGGDVIAVPVSGKTGDGLDELMESILVVAEVAEFRANPDRAATGVVVEAKLDKTRGSAVTMLVKSGTLAIGDYIVAGTARGKVKALINDLGKRVKQAGPSTPVEVLGLNQLPQAGDTFEVVENEREGRLLAEQRQQDEGTPRAGVTLEEMVTQIRMGETKELPVVVKADVQGSVEAIRDSLVQLNSEKSQVSIIHSASGAITEGDVFLAAASKAIILGFNTRLEVGAHQAAEQARVEIRLYNVIYNLLEDVRNTLEGLVEPTAVEVVEGHATVRAVFAQGNRGKVAGIYVTDGRIVRNGMARLSRNGQVIHEGPIASLRHFKENVREMGAQTECGIGLEGFNDFEEEDVIEVYRLERSRR
jgi:translation initiation factor IF-2